MDATSAHATGIGPGGRRIELPGTVTPRDERAEPDILLATVDFTPTEPGVYELEMMFEPNLGIVPVTVWSIARVTPRLVNDHIKDRYCRGLSAMETGTAICSRADELEAIFADGGRQLFERESQGSAWAIGEAEQLWVERDGGFDQYRETAAGLSLTAHCECGLEPGTMRAFAARDSLLVSSPLNPLTLYTVDGGACERTMSWAQQHWFWETNAVSWNGQRGLAAHLDGLFRFELDGGSTFSPESGGGMAANREGIIIGTNIGEFVPLDGSPRTTAALPRLNRRYFSTYVEYERRYDASPVQSDVTYSGGIVFPVAAQRPPERWPFDLHFVSTKHVIGNSPTGLSVYER